MRQFIAEFKAFFRKGDVVLLLLCLLTTAFGCLMIASTTVPRARPMMMQISEAATDRNASEEARRPPRDIFFLSIAAIPP